MESGLIGMITCLHPMQVFQFGNSFDGVTLVRWSVFDDVFSWLVGHANQLKLFMSDFHDETQNASRDVQGRLCKVSKCS